MVRYAILGPVELCDGERRVGVGGPRQVALLALLLVNANHAVSSDRLIDALWGDLGRAGALKRVQVAVTRLRRVLDRDGVGGESVLRTVAGGYLLEVRPGELDAEVFHRRLEEGRHALAAGEAQRAREVLDEALGMWRGRALAAVGYEEFAQPEIRRLEELRLAALEARVDCQLQLGAHTAVVGELEGLVAAHPGRERLAAQLMLALYRCGRQGDALGVYTRARAYLSGELGLEPGPALQTLQGEILAQSPGLQPVCDESASAAPAKEGGMLPTGVVTFVLTDVEDSTGLWETDADAMAAALELLDGLIARTVESSGGRLLKKQGEGDATLSAFHSASDAVACAAQLQRAVGTTSWPARRELRVRIALHSGEAQERGGDYFGPVLNRAARLRSLAGGGATVVSQSTAELVRDRLPRELQLVDVGPRELRGLSRPERVFELRATPDVSAGESGVAYQPVMLALPRALSVSTDSPFVGRDAEFELLRERWTHVCGRVRSAVVIGGEPGIGKTRLVSELGRMVHGDGALVLYGRCDEGLAVPYQPFVEALGPYARAIGLDRVRAELGDLAPELGRLLPELGALGQPRRGDPESERFMLFDAIAALLQIATREQRALLILEDLHWAAAPTLLLLRHLIRSERPLGALVLCTYRDTELQPGQPLAQLLADLQRDASAQRLNMNGLDQAAIAALLEATVGHPLDDHASQLARVLQAQTAGNPFFVRELLAHLTESRTRSADGERLDVSITAAQLEAPAGLRQVIGQRVARLSEPARNALRVAAVAGATFSFVLLERVLGEDSGVLDAVEEAVAAGLLTEAGHGNYAFAHALVRQTIYDQLSAARRMRLHRQLGEALEASLDTDAHVEALAYHFARAAPDGQAVKAAGYGLAAGRRATARLGYEEAAAHYERALHALALTGPLQDQRRCDLLLALGEARWGAGQLDQARHAYEQAAKLADTIGDATALANAALGYCGPHRFEVAPRVIGPIVDLLQDALAALGDDDSALHAQLMGRLSAALISAPVEHRMPELALQALEMARAIGDKATLADVLASSLWAIRGPDSLHQSLALTRELGQIADEIGDHRLRAFAHWWLLDHLLELGDIDALEHELEALQRLTETRPERAFKWVLAVARASHAYLSGRLEQCETLAQNALAHRFVGDDEVAEHTFAVQMFFVCREQGRIGEVVQTFENFAEQYAQLVIWRCARASMYAQLDRRTQASHEFEIVARTDFCDLPRDVFWLASLSALCAVADFLSDVPRAQMLYRLLLPYADRCVVTSGISLLCTGSVSRPLGLLATTLSRLEDAEHHFEQALRMNTQIRSPLWTVHTQHDYARMLLTRNRPGDQDKALELLTTALDTAEQLSLKALADNARSLMQTAFAPPLTRPI